MADRESLPQRYIRYLRVWIGFVAVMALGNTVQCFVDPQLLKSKLYTVNPEANVNGLVANLFGIWTLLSAALRFYCAIDIFNIALYHLTYFSFYLALGHFVSEVLVYKTATFSVGVMAPLIVSSLSIVTMSIGYGYLTKAQQNVEDITDETRQLASQFRSGKYKVRKE
ncbi:hypothetical protein LOTGIDRAFT_222610 [Lottia gigantea]|uniref:Ergosterol biosynthetic protein 28 n=1 Tax=Lottia gigantea TaxID=225164 RepID=V3ZH85_LOTGI|nr:hypothetical protein LOTGIDRAFT_222610 [Lottia gigantea]ESO83537.1 hypothetical protein LOTGIDRAFT_222610 [Lottia gigantea]